ncbi:MAG: hypothetical protein IH602_00390 [Bryobacteraceae bacterium]|nr:hypothetical protein [Bryobacteraceae bacterium]
MITSRRQAFNRSFSKDHYPRFLSILERRFGERAQFRHSETPCFFAPSLIDRVARAGKEMTEQIVADSGYQRLAFEAIPERYRVPATNAAPLFVQADFGLDEQLKPKLVEIQGFPSLYAYQPVMAEAYREAYGLDDMLASLPFGLGLDEYKRLLGESILGGEDPEQVVLTEIDPDAQKTRHDFRMTEQWFGVRTVDIRALKREGRRLVYERDGRQVAVRRIYNRAIVDELERKRAELQFDWRDDLDLTWAGHPNWFFLLSKFSLPYLKHPSVPETVFFDRAGEVDRPEDWVLKPLWSFAGLGVVVGPNAAQLAAVPSDRRADYILQRRVDFRPVIDTPFGPAKVEIRIMYLWLGELRPVNVIIRMGRGAQMGVDHNMGFEWVGASAAMIDTTQD